MANNPQSINDEAGLDPSQWKPIDAPPITGRPSPPSVGDITPVIPMYLQGSIDPNLQLDADFVKTAYRSSSAPRFALMPLGIQSSALTSAQITSVASSAASAGTGPGQGGTGSGGSGSGGSDSDEITLDIPSIFTPVTQTVTLPGPLEFALATEPAGTVFSGPTNAAVGFDGVFYSTETSAGSGSITTTGGTPSLPGGEYAVYIAQAASNSGALNLAGTPAGWTLLSQSITSSPQYAIAVGSLPVSATQTWVGAAQVSGMIVYLGGALPSFGNAATGIGSTSASATLTGMTVGNSILVLCQCVLRFPAPSGLLTDTQVNTPILLGSVGIPFNGTLFGSQLFMYLIPNVTSASDTVTFSVSPASSSNSLRMSVYEIAPPTAIAGIPRFQIPPQPNVGNATGILSPSNGGTGANLSATGGTSEVVMQTTVGGAFTVAQLAASNLSNGTTGSGAIVLQGSPTINSPVIGGKITSYNGTLTVGNGVASEYATVDLTAQAAAITATTLTSFASGGMNRISWVATVTTVDSVSSTLGGANGFQVIYTDQDTSVVKTSLPSVTTALNNTGTAVISGEIIVNAGTNTVIQYQFGYTSNTPGQMKYNLHVKLEAM